jgi:hypothetical protein
MDLWYVAHESFFQLAENQMVAKWILTSVNRPADSLQAFHSAHSATDASRRIGTARHAHASRTCATHAHAQRTRHALRAHASAHERAQRSHVVFSYVRCVKGCEEIGRGQSCLLAISNQRVTFAIASVPSIYLQFALRQTQILTHSAVLLPLAMPGNPKGKKMPRVCARAYPRGRAFAFRTPPAYVQNYI